MPHAPGHVADNIDEVFKLLFGTYPTIEERLTFVEAWRGANHNLAPIFQEQGFVIPPGFIPEAAVMQEVLGEETFRTLIVNAVSAELERANGVARQQMFIEAARVKGILPAPEDEDGWAFLQDIFRQIDRASQIAGINVPFAEVIESRLPEGINEFRELQDRQARFEESFSTGFDRVVAQQGIEFATVDERRRVRLELADEFSNAQFTSEQEIAVEDFLNENLPAKIGTVRAAIATEEGQDIFDATLARLRQIDPERAARLVGAPPAGAGAVSEGIEEVNRRLGLDIADTSGLTEAQRQQLTINRIDANRRVSELRRQLALEGPDAPTDTARALAEAKRIAEEAFRLESDAAQQAQASDAVASAPFDFSNSVFGAEQGTLDAFVAATIKNPQFGQFITGQFASLKEQFEQGGANIPFSTFLQQQLPTLGEDFNRVFTAGRAGSAQSAIPGVPNFTEARFAAEQGTLESFARANIRDTDFARFVTSQFEPLRAGFAESGAGRPFATFVEEELPGLEQQFEGQLQKVRQAKGRRKAAVAQLQRPIGNLPTR
ncbi:hypothetical protein CMI37_19515 [Candidatus Pacearchaeota archaeon]|nr:hypothetical protein [Candidatus Pacearchaeota archaeon]|tara:strand:+ start:115 stop:1761 length:1647 start_codon:yes stop_codon:yes gene_type:complete